MAISKFYITLMGVCCFMAIGNKPSWAETPSQSPAKPINDMIAKFREDYPAYLKEKSYEGLSDEARDKVFNTCYYRCSVRNCRYKDVKTACKEFCPPVLIQNCLDSNRG